MSKKVSKKEVSNVVTFAVSSEFTPMKVKNTLNKMSKKDLNRVHDPEERKAVEHCKHIYDVCGVEYGTLTFDLFEDYEYTWVEFAPLSESVREGLSELSPFESVDKMKGEGSRLSACAPIREGSPLLFNTSCGIVCESSKLVVVLPSGEYYDYLPEFDEFETPEGARLLRVGVSPLALSPFVWLDLMRSIGNKKVESNKRAERLRKKNAKVLERAKKEYQKRVEGLGSAIDSVPRSILDKIYDSCLEWARQKVG